MHRQEVNKTVTSSGSREVQLVSEYLRGDDWTRLERSRIRSWKSGTSMCQGEPLTAEQR